MTTLRIRTYGDPVLRRPARPVTEFGPSLHKVAEDMIQTMYDAPGVGLAAPQVGIERAFFVFDVGDGPGFCANPEVVSVSGEWTYDEGCLSVPGLWFPITRPAEVTVVGQDADGKRIELHGAELMGRMLLHETDHLKGELLIDRLDKEERKRALKELRQSAVDYGLAAP